MAMISGDPDMKPNLEAYAIELRRKTTDIHAGFLFWSVEDKILKTLCGIIDSDGEIYPPLWKMFAFHLGLTDHQIEWINCEFRGKEGPTWCVMLAFVQNNDATLMKLVDAIVKIKRLPIIFEIYEDACTLIDLICNSTDSIRDAELKIIRPKLIPKAPLVLTPLNFSNKNVGDAKHDDIPKIKSVKSHPQPGIQWPLIVMLTFADDGAEAAYRIQEYFKSKRIGALILEEQKHRSCYNELDLVESGMRQVDYIIPILTRGYYDAIKNEPSADKNPSHKLDQAYLRHIYRTFTDENITTGQNKRVRCIIPKGQPRINSEFYTSLAIWEPEASLPELVDSMLRAKRRKLHNPVCKNIVN